MVRIKAELASRYTAYDVGGTIHEARIVATVPDSPQVILEFPDDLPAAQVRARMALFVKWGEVVDWRREHEDYAPLWIPPAPGALDAAPLFEIGDTFPSDALRALGHYGAYVKLGIVDTGLFPGHNAFQGCDVRGADGDGDLQDVHGHGTHVSTTAASTWGIAKHATIIMGRGLDQANGSGAEATIANKIRRLADHGCQVIGMSLGGSPSSVMDAACDYAKSQGAVVIAAAGNDPNAAIGSPARAADLIVLAVDRERNYAAFTSGRNWTNGNRVSDYGVNIRAASKDQADGSFEASGTSMACPHQGGKAACLAGAGLSREQIIGYLLGHRASPPQVGVAELAADYGTAPPEGGDGDMTTVRERLEAIQAACDREGLRWWPIRDTDSREDVVAFCRDIQATLGIVWQHAEEAKAALGKVPGPEPGPSPPPVEPPPALGKLWTSAQHWDGNPGAVDVYGWPKGTPIRLGIDVHVEGSGAVTPLTDSLAVQALGRDGWAMEYVAAHEVPRCMERMSVEAFGEVMLILHLRALATGRRYRILHVLKDAPLGQDVPAGQPVGIVGDSGIVGLGAACNPRPIVAHQHVEGDGMTGLQACQELGLQIATLVARIPSPDDYANCRASDGKFL